MSLNVFSTDGASKVSQSTITEFLTSHGKSKRYAPGDPIVREGEFSNTVFVLLEGAADVVKADPAGNDVVVATLEKGAVIGEMGAFLDYKRSATVKARTDLVAIQFANQSFITALFKMPDLTYRVLKSFSGRVHDLNIKLMDLSERKLLMGVAVHIIEQRANPTQQTGEVRLDAQVVEMKSGIQRHQMDHALKTFADRQLVKVAAETESGFIVQVAYEKLIEFVKKLAA